MNKPSHKIIHITSVHNRYDSRIFIKMCKSLASENFRVFLIVADGKGNEIRNRVSIVDVGNNNNFRLLRMVKTNKEVLNKAIELDGDLYHIHDPELIFIGIRMKKLEKKVIFDSHEDIPSQILHKHYIIKPLRLPLSYLFSLYQKYYSQKFDSIICATDKIAEKYNKISNKLIISIKNYPIIDELVNDIEWKNKKNEISYIGSLTNYRGIEEIVKSIEKIDGYKLNLLGEFSDKKFKKKILSLPGWKKVNFYGFSDRQKIKEILSQSKIGLVTLHPTKSYLDSLPIKMFEYMSVGIPVIASNFPLWKKIISENDCGICINPFDILDITKAINHLTSNPDLAIKLGKNGLKAIRKKYNWGNEIKKLIKTYNQIL